MPKSPVAGQFKAIAVDYDGTLTTGSRPTSAVLRGLERARSEGLTVVLATGRILDELRHDFPEVDEAFDLIVAENGAVLSRNGVSRAIAAEVDPRLGLALQHRNVSVRHGRVLLACDAVDDAVVLSEVRRLGLEYQMVRNRAALMILPPGVTKGTGLAEGLADLGLSSHDTLAVGDAENDHSLLHAAEIGVAVGNAVDALKQTADLVLDEPDGDGVLAILNGPILSGRRRIHCPRWSVELGTAADGTALHIPASHANVLIIGASGAGKSFISGLIAEQVIALGYTALVLDAAGEHRNLDRLHLVLTLGGRAEPFPPPGRLGGLLSHRYGSVVLDLSLVPGPTRTRYVADVVNAAVAHRAEVGFPHWVVMEEAHLLGAADGPAVRLLTAGAGSQCLVTYHPMELCPTIVEQMEVVIAAAGGTVGHEQTIRFLAAYSGRDERDVQVALAAVKPVGGALVLQRDRPASWVPVTVGTRRTTHVRHQHKYADAELPTHLRFYFSSDTGATSFVAANIGQFHDVLSACDHDVIGFHAQRRDFSRWIRDVLNDSSLADDVAVIEDSMWTHAEVETVRHRLLRAVETRYL